MRYQAWSDGSFFPLSNDSARALLDPGALLEWEVEADSWEEAMRLYYRSQDRATYTMREQFLT